MRRPDALILRIAAMATVLAFGSAGPAALPAAGDVAPGLVEHLAIPDGTQSRSVRVFIAPKTSGVVLVALHGGGDTHDAFAESTRLEQLATERGVSIVWPQAAHRGRFNAGFCCQTGRARSNDVRFIRRAVAAVRHRHSLRGRTVAAGFSNGAFMAYRLACEAADRFDAIVSVAGTMTPNRCTPSQPVSIVHVSGDRDRRVPIAGRRFADDRLPSAREVTRRWRRLNGCRGAERFTETRRMATRRSSACSDSASVTTLVLRGVGHEWPTGSAGTIDASELVLSATSDSQRVPSSHRPAP